MIAIRLPDEVWVDVEEGTEALLGEWLVAEGDDVSAGQPIAVAVLVKTDYELTSPVAGKLVEIRVAEEESFEPGQDLAFVEEASHARPPEPAESVTPAPLSTAPPQPTARAEGSERIGFTGVRGAVARNMTTSWQSAPQVALFLEVDTSACDRLRGSLQRDVGPEPRVSLTHLILRAVALTLAEHPRLNARVTPEAIEVLSGIHLGLAMDLDGDLVVPVIRDAGGLSTAELAREARRLAEAARAHELKLSTFQGGTFTVSNLGTAGIDAFTPILNPPQAAILGIGRRAERPVVRDGKVVAAPTVQLSLIFDHRAIDGHPASLFLSALGARLERADDL